MPKMNIEQPSEVESMFQISKKLEAPLGVIFPYIMLITCSFMVGKLPM